MQTLPAYPIEENKALRALGRFAYPSSFGDVLGATAEEAWATNPIPSLWQMLPTWEADKIISPEEANARYGIDKELQFDAPVQETDARDYNKSKREELARRDIFQRSQGGGLLSAAQFGVGLAVSMVDPLNIASAFIPVVGPARYAVMLEKAGGAAGRAGIRTAVGAAEGLVGAALVEPFVYAAATQRQADYTATDSLLNLAFGTVLGGGLHSGLGALGDAIRAKKLDEPLLRESVASIVEDRPVSVEAQLRASLAESTGIEGVLRQSGDVVPGVVDAPAMARTIDGTLGQIGDVAPPRTLEAPTVSMTQIAIPTSAGDVRVFATERAAQKEAGSIRGDVNIVPIDGGFSIVRNVDVQPLRMPDGSVRSFNTERQAQKYIASVAGDVGSPVPFKDANGKRKFTVTDRNLNEKELSAFKASPDLVKFQDAPPVSAVAGRVEPVSPFIPLANAAVERQDAVAMINKQFSEAYAPGIKSWEAPEVRAIDEMLSRAPSVDLDAARVQSEIADFEALVGALDEGEAAFIKEADDMGNFADQFAVAAQAVARCRVGKA